jgi:GTPase SAR1 family protein
MQFETEQFMKTCFHRHIASALGYSENSVFMTGDIKPFTASKMIINEMWILLEKNLDFVYPEIAESMCLILSALKERSPADHLLQKESDALLSKISGKIDGLWDHHLKSRKNAGIIKINLIGPPISGKSALVAAFMNGGKIQDNVGRTDGVNVIETEYDGEVLQIWDQGGLIGDTLTQCYLKNSDGLLLVMDWTLGMEGFETWVRRSMMSLEHLPKVPSVMAVNRSDYLHLDGIEAMREGLPIFFTSAFTGRKVMECFARLVKEIRTMRSRGSGMVVNEEPVSSSIGGMEALSKEIRGKLEEISHKIDLNTSMHGDELEKTFALFERLLQRAEPLRKRIASKINAIIQPDRAAFYSEDDWAQFVNDNTQLITELERMCFTDEEKELYGSVEQITKYLDLLKDVAKIRDAKRMNFRPAIRRFLVFLDAHPSGKLFLREFKSLARYIPWAGLLSTGWSP